MFAHLKEDVVSVALVLLEFTHGSILLGITEKITYPPWDLLNSNLHKDVSGPCNLVASIFVDAFPSAKLLEVVFRGHCRLPSDFPLGPFIIDHGFL